MSKRLSTLLLVTILVVSATSPAPQAARAATNEAITLKVSTSGVDSSACIDRGNPDRPACRNIQYAIENAQNGDTILVAQGTYTYPGLSLNSLCSNYTLNNAANYPIICIIDKTLTIRGGYSDTNWNSPNTNPALTVIDGQNTHRGITSLSTSATVAKANLTLENFTVQNGYAQGIAGSSGSNFWKREGRGGGMLTDSTFTLRNVVFRNNRAYGANSSENDNPGAVGVGGALVASMPQQRNAMMEKVTFDNNSSRGGDGPQSGGYGFAGAFYTYNIILTGNAITVTNNTTQGGNGSGDGQMPNGAMADGLGGAISIHFHSQATLTNVYATGNRATGGNASNASGSLGGHGFGGAFYAESASSLYIYDSLITGNQSQGGNAYQAGLGGGGGVMATASDLHLQRVRIVGNTARGGTGTGTRGSTGGGGVYLTNFDGSVNPTFYIANTIIADNYIEMGSGPGNPGGGGGGLWIQGAMVDFSHVTLAGNRMAQDLGYGSGMIIVNFGTPYPSSITLRNCLISDHLDTDPSGGTQSTIHLWNGNTATFSGGNWANNSNNTNLENDPWTGGGPGVFNGLNTIAQKASAGYIAGFAPYYNYHLAASSPAKDQASSSSETQDFEKDSRPYATAADTGADEYQPFTFYGAPGNGSARLDWSAASARLAGGVSRYDLTVTCPTGAAAPSGFPCGTPVNIGLVTGLSLSGMSNFFGYQATLEAKNASGSTIMVSTITAVTPTDKMVYLPVTLR